MARILFTYHQPREVTFMHASVCAALALGITAGIIVEIGVDETTIVPVTIYDRRPLHVLTRSTRYARAALIERTRWLVSQFGDFSMDKLTALDLDHFIRTALVCLPRSPIASDSSEYVPNEKLEEHYNTPEYQGKVFTWTQPSTERRVSLPQWIRFAIVEIFFEARNQYADSAFTSIPVCISSIIAKATIDIRADLKAVAVTGSLCDIPGLQARIQRDTGTRLLENVHGPDLAWTGASLAASLAFGGPSITMQQFNSTSRVPDWTHQTRH
ncbi:protein of unknown function [Taphrina deformans PYCC 5710]|uniref:Carbohydrate kinase FGGY C-terminal domain-containing protein n=1 Tax=Taphrina deformans (strain PYCC 5710 / ATCC 11124 / CBS 356.35 / IMI 108563 / JCM 9778 / NBRC 8474) TaxID=1097556 RepID=R4X8M4_TAPDE|nr:protein of unknown function [Taphrina deformans PYCC 5710]|eukprot:CCG81715.1 protein of unknown function [Taphrina deformans PYCC 5710]